MLLLVPVLFLSVCMYAQPYDTTAVYEDEAIVDSSAEDQPEITDDEEYPGTQEESKYFIKKTDQPGGGGPDRFVSRRLPDSLVKKLKADGEFWYVNYPFGNPEMPEEQSYKRKTPLTETPFFQTLLWLIIIGGFAAFVIIYLSNSNAGLFRKKNRAIATGEEMEEETNNIFDINYQREIEKAVGKGNYRFAIRLMFLRLLKTLSEKNIIQYKTDRTNFDYLVQLHPTKHYNDFFRVTRDYEYSWYGQFDVDQEKFRLIKNDFDNLESKLKY